MILHAFKYLNLKIPFHFIDINIFFHSSYHIILAFIISLAFSLIIVFSFSFSYNLIEIISLNNHVFY